MQAVDRLGSQTPSVSRISMEQPWDWLREGWKDVFAAPHVTLAYGLGFVLIGAMIFVGLNMAGAGSWIAVFAGGFLLVGPMLAVGLYETSRRLETGEPVSLPAAVFVRTASPLQLAYFGFALLFAFLVWARIAQLLFALFMGGSVTIAEGDYPDVFEFFAFATSNPSGLALLVIGSVFGAALAFGVYAMSVITPPLLMEKRTDIYTAVSTSIRAVVMNRGPMLLWAWIIAIVIAVSIATMFIGLVIAFPLIGCATWRAYRDLVPQSE